VRGQDGLPSSGHARSGVVVVQLGKATRSAGIGQLRPESGYMILMRQLGPVWLKLSCPFKAMVQKG